MVIRKKLEDRQERTTYFMIVASCVCLILQLYAIPRNSTGLMSIANHGILLLWLGVGGIRVIKRLAAVYPAKLMSFIWMLLLTVLALLVGILRGTYFAVSDITSFVNFMVFPMMLMHSAVYTVPDKAKTVLVVTAAFLSILFIALYHSDFRFVYTGYYGKTYIDQVTLGYPNPNQAAMYLFICVVILFTGIFSFRQWPVKALLILDVAYLCWILTQTESRTAVLLLIVFFILSLVMLKRNLPVWSVDVAIFTPLGYALLAMFFFPIFGTITLWGEPLFNGRENIFERYLDNLNILNFLLGDYRKFNFQNLHSGYVSIAATVGIVALAFFMIFIRTCLRQNHRGILRDKQAKIGFIGFLCVLVYTSTEAAFFVGGSTYAFLIFAVFMFFSQPFVGKQPLSYEEHKL